MFFVVYFEIYVTNISILLHSYINLIDLISKSDVERRIMGSMSINRKPILYSIIMIKRIVVTVLLCLSFSPLLITFCGLRAFFYILLMLCGLYLTFVWHCFFVNDNHNEFKQKAEQIGILFYGIFYL